MHQPSSTTIRCYICPQCRALRGVDINYGYPTHELFEKAERGEAFLGGCCIEENAPERHCLACHHEWRIKRREKPDFWKIADV